MVTFIEIECVERTNGFVTGIYGTIAAQTTGSDPTKGRLRAIQEAKGPVFYRPPNGDKELIIEFKVGENNMKSFFLPDPNNPQENFLDTFPEC